MRETERSSVYMFERVRECMYKIAMDKTLGEKKKEFSQYGFCRILNSFRVSSKYFLIGRSFILRIYSIVVMTLYLLNQYDKIKFI